MNDARDRLFVETPSKAKPAHEPSENPTRVRYVVLAFLATMTFILYVDRSCINQAAPIIKRELEITQTDISTIFNAFALSYAVFEIPAGRWGDRYGSRRILTRIVLWWSLFTALTGFAWGFASLVVIRFLFGAGEAGALPNSARVLRAWFPDSSRGRAQGFVTTAMMLGAASAPVTSQWLINSVGWRSTFVIFAVAGVIWAIAFFIWFRDEPALHSNTNQSERQLIAGGRNPHVPSVAVDSATAAQRATEFDHVHGRIPWKCVLSSANIWLLSAVMMTMSAIHEVLSSWYPTYLQSARGATPDVSGHLASMVLTTGAVGTFLGGWLTDWLVKRTGSRRWGRTAQAIAGAGLAAGGILASIWTDSTEQAAAFLGLTAFGVQLQLPAWWASATQVSGRHLGALFGLMNMLGGIGRLVSQQFVGRFADWRQSLGHSGRAQWDPALYVYVVIALIGMALWALINPEKTVDDRPRKPTDPDSTAA